MRAYWMIKDQALVIHTNDGEPNIWVDCWIVELSYLMHETYALNVRRFGDAKNVLAYQTSPFMDLLLLQLQQIKDFPEEFMMELVL